MRILALESTAKAASAAILTDGRLTALSIQSSGLTHSRTLLPMCEDMLKNCGLLSSDVDLFAVARGPGSFTGVRIGTAAAKGLAWAAEKPCCGVSTLEAMALPLRFMEDTVLCCAMDARRSQVYNALFEVSGGGLVRLCPDRAISMEILAEELEKIKKSVIFVGDGAELCYNNLYGHFLNSRMAPEPLRLQNAYGVALAASDPQRRCPALPEYLRKSQAERERDSRMNNG